MLLIGQTIIHSVQNIPGFFGLFVCLFLHFVIIFNGNINIRYSFQYNLIRPVPVYPACNLCSHFQFLQSVAFKLCGFLKILFYWSIVDFQCCVSFRLVTAMNDQQGPTV